MKATSLTLALSLSLSLLGMAGAYTVQKGDTLYSLARANNLTVETLRRLNNLTSDALAVGQVLRLKASDALPPSQPAPLSQSGPLRSSPAPSGFTLTAPPSQAAPSIKLSPLKPGSAQPSPTQSNPTQSRPGQPSPAQPTPAPITLTPSGKPVAVSSGSSFEVGNVGVTLPSVLSMGDAFVVKLTGEAAKAATVRFPSELGEDVRLPNEALTPSGAAGVYLVPGRVVLGKTTPVIVQISVGDEVVRGIIPLRGKPSGPVVHLKLAPQVAKKLTDPGKAAEDAMVDQAYLRRGSPLWTKPFAAPLAGAPIPGSFGQSRTYVAGGPVVYHYGADYPAKLGTPVHAVNDGTVVIAGTYPVRGGLVMIDHGGGVSSLYFHQSKLLVKVGQTVERGEVIGLVGTTGLSEGPHLHLEIRVRGEATQPAEWINRLWP